MRAIRSGGGGKTDVSTFVWYDELFGGDQHVPDRKTKKEESFEELDKLKNLLGENPNVLIQISGHTDNTGNNKFNLELSKKRAEAVSMYLINKNIDKNRIIAKGFGEQHPIVSNDDEYEGRELNRRVEFTVLRNIN